MEMAHALPVRSSFPASIALSDIPVDRNKSPAHSAVILVAVAVFVRDPFTLNFDG